MSIIAIDRFEGDFAVCETEDGSMRDILRIELPDGCREGSVLRTDPNGKWIFYPEEEARRRNRAAELERELFGSDR